jgi:hypothetical protein
MKQLLIFLQLLKFCFAGHFGLVVSETIENCAPKGQDAKALDKSNFEVISESDTEFFFNGSIKIMRNYDNASFHIYTEKFIRGKWHREVYNAKRRSFCESFHNPSEAWYIKMRRLKGCPLNAGVRKCFQFRDTKLLIKRSQDEWTWDMEPCDLTVAFNSYLQGKWRITIRSDFYDRGKHEIDCVRYYGDIMEF